MAKNSELREHAAILREQKGHQQSMIAEMEKSLQQLEQKVTALEADLELYAERELGIELTPEEIAAHIDRSATEKSSD